MVIIPIISSRDYRWAIDELQWLLTRIIALFTRKCSKHQGPHAQVIHMDLDHVINSIAVIGNMKLWSQVICWCYQHCCWTQSVFKIPSPFHFGVSQMKFSFGFPGCFTQRISPTLLPMTASNWKAGFQSSLAHGAPLPLLGGLEVWGGQEGSSIDPLAPRNLAGELHTLLRNIL